MAKLTYERITSDGIKLHGIHWKKENPRAVIALVHGFGEHADRYNHLAAWFGEKGFSVVAYDRRGHGQSGGKRGHTPSYSAYLDEIDILLDETRKVYPGIPVVIWGHSQGGNLVLSHIIERKPEAKAVVVTGPWIQLAFNPPGFLVALGKVMKSVYPKFTNKNQLDANHISHDPEVVKKYVEDPLVHDLVTAATGTAMLDSADRLNTYSGELPLPTLIMHGGDDKVTSRPASEAFHSRVSGDVSLKVWDGFYHEIHNEPEQDQVFSYAMDWLEKKL